MEQENLSKSTQSLRSRSKLLSNGFVSGDFRSNAFLTRYRRGYVLDLTSLIALCDLNYHRLMMLIPDQTATEVKKIDIMTDSSVKAVVELSIQDRSKYTSVVSIEQKPELKWGANPRLKVRLYHDTKSAEVIEYQDQNRFRSHYDFPNKRMRQTDEKVQLNLFLGEYLKFCLLTGASEYTLPEETQKN